MSLETVLPLPRWRALESAHEARADALTAGHRERRARGIRHPVEDFLFTYYRHSPAQLRRWHPGVGIALEGAGGMPRAGWRGYVTDGGTVRVDLAAVLEARASAVERVREILARTRERPAQLSCFGLHEWAMVYRLGPDDVRHQGWPLRLGTAGTAAVVERHQLRCTHFDAFRFFTPDAAPRNQAQLTRASQPGTEQPGCLHAGMDVYRWCYELTPLVPSTLTLDAFEFARRIRRLDMAASPYDLRALGLDPVPIETPEGKARFVARQRRLAAEADGLRERLLDVIERAVDA